MKKQDPNIPFKFNGFQSGYLIDENQVFIQMSGKKDNMVGMLKTVISQIEQYGKPIQTNHNYAGTEIQVITNNFN